jgi:hypothetical protein
MRSSLARRQPVAPTDETELERMRRAAWLQQGVVCLRPDEIADDWLRRALQNLAIELWGQRT